MTNLIEDPQLAAFIDSVLRREITAKFGGFTEAMADQYIPAIRAAVLQELDAAGYVVTKKAQPASS